MARVSRRDPFLISMKTILALLTLLLFLTAHPSAHAARETPRAVHVVVALCDNENQGIVPVPMNLGNGQDASGNLYWGAAYGVKTFMRRQAGWELVRTEANPRPAILERLYFRNTALNVVMVADAYDGRTIQKATADFLAYTAGSHVTEAAVDSVTVKAGGGSELVVYIGHNGLMDFPLSSLPSARGVPGRTASRAAIFACRSKSYFGDPLRESGSYPLIWTRGNMAPEAYSLHALVTAWAEGRDAEAIREAVAQAYDRYQKCGIRGARGLFATGW